MSEEKKFFDSLEKRQPVSKGDISSTLKIRMYQDLINKALDKGYKNKTIWLTLVEDYSINVSYSYFTRVVNKINQEKIKKTQNKANEHKEHLNKKPTQGIKPKKEPIFNPPKKKTFVYNPTPRADILKVSNPKDKT